MENKNERKVTKRGKPKGGKRFPLYDLGSLEKNLASLVSKTHSTTINAEQLNSGVFNMGPKSIAGAIRLSAMRQFGFVEGKNDALSATKLATDIVKAKEDDKKSYLAKAFSNVRPFNDTLKAHQKETVDKKRITTYVSAIGVHSEKASKFSDIFMESAQTAGLGKIKGDNIELGKFDIEIEETVSEEEKTQPGEAAPGEEMQPGEAVKKISSKIPNLSINIDPTLDPEKLEKQLKILRKFGLI